MNIELNPIEIRVLGCLIEKESATPDYYPLTLNALVSACNQKSNRAPVMELDENSVMRTLDELRMTHQLAVEVTSTSTRVAKYKHAIRLKWDLPPAKTALLCELFLRGPQTAGDLRAHAARLHPLANSHEVGEILRELENSEEGPFVVHLPREPGKRERRWAHLFSGEPEISDEPVELHIPTEPLSGPTRNERIEVLENEVAELRQELNELKAAFADFKTAFE